MLQQKQYDMVTIRLMVTKNTWIKDTISHRHKGNTMHTMLQ